MDSNPTENNFLYLLIFRDIFQNVSESVGSLNVYGL